DRALLELMYATGLRVSEVAALTGSQLRLDEGFVTVLGKGGKERVVPLGRQAKEALASYLATARPRLAGPQPPPWVFVRHGGQPPEHLEARPEAGSRGRRSDPRHAAHPPAYLRDAPPRRRRGSPRRPDAARPRRHRDHADLHARRAGTPPRRPSQAPPARIRH